MKPKISIIVPTYNVENYLARCLDSLLAQSLEDIEIIAVNDGSIDGSLQILKHYADQDLRIVIIDKENGGVSSARNEGIMAAKGEYIGFVDPDDWVDQAMYQAMFETAVQQEADIVMCSYVREFGSHSKVKRFDFPDQICFRNKEVHTKVMRRLVGPLDEEMARPEFLDAWGTVWSKLYRAEIIKENGLQFIDLSIVGTNEDSLFNIYALYYAKTFVFLNQPYYHYWRANTASLTSGHKPQLVDQWFLLYDFIESFLQDKQLEEEFYLALNNRICLNTLGLGLNMISKGNHASGYRKIRKLRGILNDERIKHSFMRFEMRYFSLVWRVFYFCAKLRFAVGFYFMLIAMDWLRKAIR